MRRNITIILFLLVSISFYGQIEEDIMRFRQLNVIESADDKYPYARTYQNEMEFIFTRLFLFYKNFISSQDATSCTFTPSCSEYAILTIKEQGVIIGTMNFFDRFSRCNGLSPEHYNFDPEKRVLIDPPRDFKYEMLE
ncbi:MAG TPA: membrane protein insertion efficiency factor YidD [Bacteroidales bacterium]|nr:membrane protein insertion efficiency factor YidD [Bacteroidales bacterium]